MVHAIQVTCARYARGELDVCDAADAIESVLGDTFREATAKGAFKLEAPLAHMDQVEAIPLHYALACLRRSEAPHKAQRPKALPSPPPLSVDSTRNQVQQPLLASLVAAAYGCLIRLWFADRDPGPPHTFGHLTEGCPHPIDVIFRGGRYVLITPPQLEHALTPLLSAPGPGHGLPMALMFALNISNLQGITTGLGARSLAAALKAHSDQLPNLAPVAAKAQQSPAHTFQNLLIAGWLKQFGAQLSDIGPLCQAPAPPAAAGMRSGSLK